MSSEPLRLVSLSEHADFGADAIAQVKAWTVEFLMSDHPELGRGGNVCPYAALGAKLNSLRFSASDANAGQTDRIRRQLRSAVAQFDEIPSIESSGLYRAILIAFPECAGADGLAALTRAQKSLRFVSFFRARMIGVFHPQSEARGLRSQHFRPMRSPVPLVAIRCLVAADAAFALRHPPFAAGYLRRFPLAGARRLAEQLLRRA
jgi:hypothetical protein